MNKGDMSEANKEFYRKKKEQEKADNAAENWFYIIGTVGTIVWLLIEALV